MVSVFFCRFFVFVLFFLLFLLFLCWLEGARRGRERGAKEREGARRGAQGRAGIDPLIFVLNEWEHVWQMFWQ